MTIVIESGRGEEVGESFERVEFALALCFKGGDDGQVGFG